MIGSDEHAYANPAGAEDVESPQSTKQHAMLEFLRRQREADDHEERQAVFARNRQQIVESPFGRNGSQPVTGISLRSTQKFPKNPSCRNEGLESPKEVR
jgi:hypothetical protein